MKIDMNKKGFTLIELLIVIAIIAILAAIAIPQFSAYRMRGFNASAESDARNMKNTEEAMNTAFASYGRSFGNPAAVLPGPGAFGNGQLVTGSIAAASIAQAGSGLTTTWVTQRAPALLSGPGGIGIGLGNNVDMAANSLQDPAGDLIAVTAQLYTKHIEGDTVFGADVDGTAIFYCKSSLWPKVRLTVAGFPATGVGVLPNNDDFAGQGCGGDAPTYVNWLAL